MRVSWHDHKIEFTLDGSLSAISWLHKNISTITNLKVFIEIPLAKKSLQELFAGGR
jgi:hypothetical protein